jgi:hypothetical protein
MVQLIKSERAGKDGKLAVGCSAWLKQNIWKWDHLTVSELQILLRTRKAP